MERGAEIQMRLKDGVDSGWDLTLAAAYMAGLARLL